MSLLLVGRQTTMPPVCSLRQPVADSASDPFARLAQDPTKDDLESLFGGDEDDIFRDLDLNTIDIDDVDLSVFESSYDTEDDSDGECLNSKFRESRNHDCMWGGQCCNKEFQRTQVIPTRPPVPPSVVYTRSSQEKVVTIQKCVPARTADVVVVNSAPRTEGRSLLLNRTTHAQQRPSPVVKQEPPTPQSSRPETPQSLSGSDEDDFSPIPIESHQNAAGIFRSALKALTTPKWEDELLDFGARRIKTEPGFFDSSVRKIKTEPGFYESSVRKIKTEPGLYESSVRKIKTEPGLFDYGAQRIKTEPGLFDYGAQRIKNEPSSPRSQNELLRLCASSATSDHNYDGSSKTLKLEGLGVDTPSDSEEDEEIDVVSLSSRSSSCGRLPTRPTARDQETLEEITTSLLSASQAVSRKIKQEAVRQKRKKYPSESSDDDEEEDDEEEEEGYESFERYEDYEPPVAQRAYRRQNKRARASPNRVRRGKSARFGGEEDKERRDLHNNMERMRRIDLRISFDELKALVPGVANKDRAAKVVILREAAQYCSELGADSQSKQMQVQALRKEQMRLRAMVSSLRKAAAMAVKHY